LRITKNVRAAATPRITNLEWLENEKKNVMQKEKIGG